MRHYHEAFQPTELVQNPMGMVTVFTVCAESDEEAEYLAGSLDLSMLFLSQGIIREGTPHPKEIHELSLSQFEKARIDYNRSKMIIGSPKTIGEKIRELSERFHTNEIMLVTITHSYEAKENSFRLIAEELLK